MRPKDLKSPFPWKERRPWLSSQILFVPAYYEGHAAYTLPSFDDPSLFGREAPLHLEYCSGNGDWVVAKAAQEPERNWICVEKRFDRIRKIWSKRENRGVKNLLIVSGEAYTFSKYYLPTSALSSIHINFPDPWPKGKHAKHRLFQPSFVAELARTTRPDALLHMVTDDATWAERMQNATSAHDHWIDPVVTTENQSYGSSFFEALFRKQGKTIYYTRFTKKGEY